MKARNIKNKRGMALSQIIIILLGTIAFSYILGSEIGVVSAVNIATLEDFPFGGYILTDNTSGCRLYNPIDNSCYAFDATTDLWYPDTNKNGNPDDGTSAVSGLTGAVYSTIVPSGYGGVGPETFSYNTDAKFRVWKNAAENKYVLTWGNFLTEKNSQGRWYNNENGGDVLWGSTFDSQVNTYLATLSNGEDDTTDEDDVTDENTGRVIQNTACAQYANGAVFSSSCSAGCFADALVAASDGACCIYGCTVVATDDDEEEEDGGEDTGTDITTLLSSAGTGMIQDCAQIIGGDWSKMAACLDAATKLASKKSAGDAGSAEECMKQGFGYEACNTAFGGADDKGVTNKVCTKYASMVPCGEAFNFNCNDGTFGGGEGKMGCDGAPDTKGNWQGDQIGKNILSIIVTAVEAVSFYLLLKQLEKAIPFLANLDPTSSAAALLNLGEAVIAGGSIGVNMLINNALFNAAIPSLGTLTGTSAALAWSGIGIAVAVALFLIFYQQTTVKAVALTCIPWQAPLGGDNCRLCGANGLPCSEYQCKSLGQGCGLLPSGENGEVLCEFLNEGDTIPPIMSFYNQLPVGYTASPAGASVISQNDTGVVITSPEPDGKIPPSTLLTVGVTTDEPSRCGISLVRYPIISEAGEDTFKQLMPMSAGLFRNEHAFVLNSPGIEEILTTSGKMDLYVRCGDGNGNNATAYFVIEFEVSEIPDTSPPIVVRTDLPDNSPVPFEIGSLRLPIYINERTDVAECKWSRNNRAYDEMEETADCNGAGTGLILGGGNTGMHKCFAQISGIVDGQTNTYYFRCKDTLGNVHSGPSPFSLRLRGTQPLEIISANPNNTLIKDSTDSVAVTFNVRTAAGSEADGTARCEYNNTVGSNRYTPFDHTLSYISTHEVWLSTGSYVFPIKCVDPAGNADYSQINFRVETDLEAPVIVRASHENANLNVKTNEESRCVYDVVDCNYEFDDGISMITSDGVTHATSWVSGRTYYIKCQDLFERAPTINSCSVNGILSTSQF